jgi:hypothetical protein
MALFIVTISVTLDTRASTASSIAQQLLTPAITYIIATWLWTLIVDSSAPPLSHVTQQQQHAPPQLPVAVVVHPEP